MIICAMDSENILDYPTLVTGIGVSNVIRSVSNWLSNGQLSLNEPIINIGLAGSTVFPVGTIVSVNKAKRVIDEYEQIEYTLPTITDTIGTCFTSDIFMETDQEMDLVDMELYYLCAFGFNVTSIKVVSDNLNYGNYEQFDILRVKHDLDRIVAPLIGSNS